MQTKLLRSNQLDEIVTLLKKSEVVALPTETVYGLAADACNEAAIKKIFIAKGRPTNHPLILHIANIEQIHDWAENIPRSARKLAQHFWPGPLTMILKKKDTVSALICGGLNTIAIRIPNNKTTLEIIEKLGNGIVAPSANAHKKTSPTLPEHVLKTLKNKIAAVVDGGPCSVGIESTIIDMTKNTPLILRPGAITAAMIENVINQKVKQPFSHSQSVAGNMKVHYQPEKKLFLLSREEIEALSQNESDLAIVHYSAIPKYPTAHYYQMPLGKTEYAALLYATLHHIDATNAEKIIIETPPNTQEWSDIRDRLLKAAAKE